MAGAERGSEGNLACPYRPARQQQVGDVAARDEQHDADGSQQRQQPLPVVTDELFDEWHGAEADRLVVFWKTMSQAHRHNVKLTLDLASRHAPLQSSVDGEIVLVVRGPLLRCKRDRRPQLIAVRGQIERLGHHAQ